MTGRLLVSYPDAEALTVDCLTPLLTGVTVGVTVPAAWTRTAAPHLQVAMDGTPRVFHPMAQQPTVRLTARAGSTSVAKAIAQEAAGRLIAGPWPDGITNVQALTGPFPARDPQTHAELASVTVRVTVRSTPLDGS